MNKIRVAAVSYLNTKPLLYGIKNHPVRNEIELIEDYPSKIAQMLIDDKVDVALIPVAAILKLKQWHIVTDYCIGSNGAVASVCIFSEVPMPEIKSVYLDYQSRTSINLAKILLKEYWNKEVVFIDAKGEDFRKNIRGTTAAVVIGDRALEQRTRSKYSYDLGEAWKAHTGLPFVYAAWVANKQLPTTFIKSFNEANAFGLQHLAEVIKENPCKVFDLNIYYTENINYRLTSQMKIGLAFFLDKLKNYLQY